MNLPNGLYRLLNTTPVYAVIGGTRYLWGGDGAAARAKFGNDAEHFIQDVPDSYRDALAALPNGGDWRGIPVTALPDPRDPANWNTAGVVTYRRPVSGDATLGLADGEDFRLSDAFGGAMVHQHRAALPASAGAAAGGVSGIAARLSALPRWVLIAAVAVAVLFLRGR